MKRKFISGSVNHCYQKTINGEVIFYCVIDYLVCFTHISVASRRHPVKVLSQILMPDHLHASVVAEREWELGDFVQDYTSHFARAHNVTCHRDAPLFKPFGSAPKVHGKDVRSHLVYLGNNGPERRLSTTAEEYRWSFLAYAKSDHPFSEKLRLDYASRPMRRAIQEVKACRKADRPLSYTTLRRITEPLNPVERQQLTDFIITAYQYIDFPLAMAYFGDWEGMLSAMHHSKGSEFELKEEFVGWDDKVYAQMSQILVKKYGLTDVHDILSWPEAERNAVSALLRTKTEASSRQIAKFLRLDPWHLPH